MGLLCRSMGEEELAELGDPKTATLPQSPLHCAQGTSWKLHYKVLFSDLSPFYAPQHFPRSLRADRSRLEDWLQSQALGPALLFAAEYQQSIIVKTDLAVTQLVSFLYGHAYWLKLSLLHDGQGYARKKKNKTYKQTLTFTVLCALCGLQSTQVYARPLKVT